MVTDNWFKYWFLAFKSDIICVLLLGIANIMCNTSLYKWSFSSCGLFSVESRKIIKVMLNQYALICRTDIHGLAELYYITSSVRDFWTIKPVLNDH